MSPWSYLCRKHFEQERDLDELDCWCGLDKDNVDSKCDYIDGVSTCKNKAYREVYFGLDFPKTIEEFKEMVEGGVRVK